MNQRPPFVIWLLRQLKDSSFCPLEDRVLAQVALKAVEEYQERNNPDIDDGA